MQQKAASAADRSLAATLNSALIHALRAVATTDAAAPVGKAGLSALSVLVFAGSQRLGDLAAAERVTKATMSRVVDGLERRGMARRRADPDDGRAVWIDATEAGRDVLMSARDRRLDRLAAGLSTFSAAERAQLARAAPLLERLVDVLE